MSNETNNSSNTDQSDACQISDSQVQNSVEGPGMVGDRTGTVVSDVDGVSMITCDILMAVQSLRMVKTQVWGEAGPRGWVRWD